MEQMKFPETYELVMQSGLKELGLNAYVLRHRKTGARVICLPADDPNKTFAIAFRTPPIDNSGLTHILEHSVLCGSDKFPVKDPFVELMKTSPNTFLNAMTYPDKTIYPVSSCNDKDFANLMDVYLDAVFHPQLHRDERIFRQEGWRYELESEDGEMNLNGVVYSEMKGAFSSSDEILERFAKQSLFPDTAYGFESGGAPEAIPTLTYEKFCGFHKKLYHPSNSWIYLYGDCDMEDRLRFIDEAYLAAYDREEIDSELKMQPAFDAERELSITYPVGADEGTDDRAYYSLQWVTGTAGDVRTMAALSILEQVLLNAPGAPLKQALLDAGLGKDVSGSNTAEILQPYFAVMAKDAPVGKKEKFEKVVRGTLTKLAEEGLNRNALRAAISNSEFQTREADFGGLSKGLIFGLEILRNWLYDLDDPFRPLRYDDDYAFFKENVDKGYFEELIRTLFIDNPHCSLIEMIPEPGKTERDEAELKQKLAEYKDSLSADERRTLAEKSADLKRWQETPDSEEALATVPKITVADLSPKARPIVNEEDGTAGVKIVHRAEKTSGIDYLQFFFPLENVPAEAVPWLGLYKACFNQVSTAEHGYRELYDLGMELTGGMSFSLESVVRFREGGWKPMASVSVKVLHEKLAAALDLLKEILLTSRFDDEQRLREILAETVTGLRQSLIGAGHMAAMRRSMSYYDEKALFGELTGGLDFFRFASDLEQHFEEEKGAVTAKLADAARRTYKKNGLIVNVTAEEEAYPRIKELLGSFAAAFPEDEETCFSLPAPEQKNEGIKTSGGVGYVAMTGSFFKAGPYTGALQILRTALSAGYLWQNVRVLGGAYGCMCRFPMSGDAYLVSYRDPNVRKTKEVYEAIPAWLENLAIPQEAVDGFIISTVGGTMDMPLTPSLKGSTDFRMWLSGVTQDDLQKEREEALACTPETLQSLSPYVKAVLDQNNLCVFGSVTGIDADSDLFLHTEML